MQSWNLMLQDEGRLARQDMRLVTNIICSNNNNSNLIAEHLCLVMKESGTSVK
jgi:hypothetical protein